MEKMGVPEKVTPEKIKLVSKGGEEVLVLEPTQMRTKIKLEENSWYSAEVWGSIDEKEDCLIALTAPLYTKGEI